jgi:hypothetical protein
MKKSNTTTTSDDVVKYKNRITGDIVYGPREEKIETIDGKDFIFVYHNDRKRLVKMLASALQKTR